MKKVTKAVFPVAGLGTRFLPITKASPKEMLPIVDKPIIQYAVEEAINAGITELIFITGRTKGSITNHFDKAYEYLILVGGPIVIGSSSENVLELPYISDVDANINLELSLKHLSTTALVILKLISIISDDLILPSQTFL